MKVFVYAMDVFVPVDLTGEEVLKAFEEDKLKPFELVKDAVEKTGIKKVNSVAFYDAYFKRGEFLIEYLVEFSLGKLAVKIIAAENPRTTLMEYYRSQRTRT